MARAVNPECYYMPAGTTDPSAAQSTQSRDADWLPYAHGISGERVNIHVDLCGSAPTITALQRPRLENGAIAD